MAIPLETQIIGRGSHKGPQTGGYVTIPFSWDTVSAGSTRIKYFNAPFEGRISEVSAYYDVLTGAEPDWLVRNETDNQSIVSNHALPTARTVERFRGSPVLGGGLANILRDFAQDHVLSVTITAGGGEAVSDLIVMITLYSQKHVVALVAEADPTHQD